MDEKLLITQLKTGNQKAFDTIFRNYYKYLVVVAFQYLKDNHQAKDMAQEVFCDMWKRREEVQIQLLKPYLRQAVVNKCLGTLRKTKRMEYDPDLASTSKVSKRLVDEEVEYLEVNTLIQKTVEDLPNRCKEIFKLSRYENLSHQEIADRLDISKKTIENQMTKALRTIRNVLKEYGVMTLILFFINK